MGGGTFCHEGSGSKPRCDVKARVSPQEIRLPHGLLGAQRDSVMDLVMDKGTY